MTYTQIASMVQAIGLPFAYDHFAEGESPEPPFVLFLLPGTNNFMADGDVYEQVTEVSIELYTDRKDPSLEERVEDVLRTYEIPWDKTEVWIEDEKMYEVRYGLEVFYDGSGTDEDADDAEGDEDVSDDEDAAGDNDASADQLADTEAEPGAESDHDHETDPPAATDNDSDAETDSGSDNAHN